MIESTGSDMCVLLSTNANHQGLKTLYDGGENQTGEWKSVYVTNPYAYVMESLNELFFTFWGNAGAENVIYISFVAEGDATQW